MTGKLFISVCIALCLQAGAAAQMLEKPLAIGGFALQDHQGQTVSLSQFRGKTVLLDFWASWCAPCRVVNKKLAKIYPKYQHKNFEIISISVDEDTKKWKRAIQKDKMTWPQLINGKTPEDNIAFKWHINSIPRSFLLNEKGEIVALNLALPELEGYLNQRP